MPIECCTMYVPPAAKLLAPAECHASLTVHLQLGNVARVQCQQQGSCNPACHPCCAARIYFRAAVGLLERSALVATAETGLEDARVQGAGTGQYAERNAAASRPYAALGRNTGPSVRLVRALGWWARLEMHLGCAVLPEAAVRESGMQELHSQHTA